MENIWIFWLIFGSVFTVLLGFKLYMRRGYRQALGPRYVKLAKTLSWFSIAAHVAGFFTIVISFSKGLINMSWGANFTIAMMMSVLVCELILALFFLSDDILLTMRFILIKAGLLKNQGAQPIPTEGRRRFLKTTGLVLTALPFVSFMRGITIGKYDFRTIKKTLFFADLPEQFDGFKIVQISDIHSGSFDSFDDVARGVQMIKDAMGDVILFTGDLVNDLSDEILPYKELFGSLSAKHGKYSTLGNHDYAEDAQLFRSEQERVQNLVNIKQHHADMNFEMLNNRSVNLEKDGATIRLVGVENWGAGPFTQRGNLDVALEGTSNDDFTVLMSHDPSHWTAKVLPHEKKVHLTLSGHTHGMQMGVELPYIKWSPVQYVYPQWAGLYSEAEQYIYVNRGFGFIGFAGRVGILPEITVIELKKLKV